MVHSFIAIQNTLNAAKRPQAIGLFFAGGSATDGEIELRGKELKTLQTLQRFFNCGEDIEIGSHLGDVDDFFDWGLQFAEHKFQLETFQHLR